jgi:hypothetical protein
MIAKIIIEMNLELKLDEGLSNADVDSHIAEIDCQFDRLMNIIDEELEGVKLIKNNTKIFPFFYDAMQVTKEKQNAMDNDIRQDDRQ